MRDPVENISILQKQLNELQLENQLLKNILDRSGISYFSPISGAVLMFMQNVRRRKTVNPDIILSVIISGLKHVPESMGRR